MKTLKLPLKLTVCSILYLIIFHNAGTTCSNSYGLAVNFIHTHCHCGKHVLPIDLLGLTINMVYHFVIWYSIIYLWYDAKETWAMIFIKNKVS